mgnify:CR=1 FL=1
MKINKQEIELLSETITTQLCDNNKLSHRFDDAIDKMRNSFKKTPYCKSLQKILNDDNIVDVCFKSVDYWFQRFSSIILRPRPGLDAVEKDFRERAYTFFNTKPGNYVDSYKIKQSVKSQLVIKSIQWTDIEKIIEDITKSLSKQYNLW